MAFASSPAAFGIQSKAQPSTLFGASSVAQQPTSNIFGAGLHNQGQNPQQPQQQQQQQQQQSNIFGGGVAAQGQNPQQHQQSNIFGGGAQGQNPQQQQHQQSNIFGGGAQGQNPQQQQHPQSNIFGGGAQAQIPQQQQQPTTLFQAPFGTQGQQPTGQPQQSTFGTTLGIGNPQAQQQQQQQQFGAPNANPFASFARPNPAPQQQQQTNIWGSATQKPQQVQPIFTRLTKFNDLPEEARRVFEGIDAFIQGRIQISKDLKQRSIGEEAMKGQELITGVRRGLNKAASVTHADLVLTQDIRAKAEQAARDTATAIRIIDAFRAGAGAQSPQSTGVMNMQEKRDAAFPLEFFTRVTEQMRERLAWYKSTIEQIERKLSSVASQAHFTPQTIASTLQAQHATFLTLASKTAAADAEVQKLKALYTTLWRARTGSARDPFEDGVGPEGESAWESLPGLSVR